LLAGDAHAPHLERLEVNQHFGHADCLGLSWIVLGCVGVCWGVLGCLRLSWGVLEFLGVGSSPVCLDLETVVRTLGLCKRVART
jgi:hypothetical protein